MLDDYSNRLDEIVMDSNVYFIFTHQPESQNPFVNSRLQLFIKVLCHFKNFQKNNDILVKDLHCTEPILQIFDEFINSRKVKKLIYINKSSNQFRKASTIKPCKTVDKGTGDGIVNAYGELPKATGASNLMFVEKQKEVLNITIFNQSNLQNIGKFYNMYNEIEYIKEEIMKLFKQVKIFRIHKKIYYLILFFNI